MHHMILSQRFLLETTMTTVRNFWIKGILCFTVIVSFSDAQAQGTSAPLYISFDGSPLQPLGTEYGYQVYLEAGMWFRPINATDPASQFSRVGGGLPSLPDNGTAYLHAASGESLLFTSLSGLPFDLVSVDLAEYSTIIPDAVTVQFVGYRRDGTVVTTDITSDGLIDGTGPIPDFQTFTFDSRFTALHHVEIPTYGWSLDNLVISIPEPASSVLLLVGSAFMFFLKQRIRS